MSAILLSIDLVPPPSMKSAKFDKFSMGGLGDATYQMMGEVLSIEKAKYSFLLIPMFHSTLLCIFLRVAAHKTLKHIASCKIFRIQF